MVVNSSIHIAVDSYLVTIMGLVIPWSCTLAIVDIYSLFAGCPLRLPRVMVIVVIGDWVCIPYYYQFKESFLHTLSKQFCELWQVLSVLSLAAACASASVIDLLIDFDGAYCPTKFCGRYQLSAAMAFLSWFLTAASSLFNLWLVASWWLFLMRLCLFTCVELG